MPNLSDEDARARFEGARVARMATADSNGQPHVVVHTFALTRDGRIVHAIDHKPKRTTDLKRLRNVRENPRGSVLVDHYEDEWERLWWVRADGVADVLELEEERVEPLRLLSEKYAQYRERPPEGPVIAVAVTRWSGWSYSEPSLAARRET